MKRINITQVAQDMAGGMRLFVMNNIMLLTVGVLLLMFCGLTHAEGADLLANALNGDVKATIGSSGKFWKIFILIDIVLAAAAAVKTKNPLVFGGVFFTAFIPAVLISAMVFK